MFLFKSNMWRYFFVMLLESCFQMHNFETTDPCVKYVSTNDTMIVVAFTGSSGNSSSCLTLQPFRWYRYTGTDHGRLTDTCPEETQCGGSSQIWFNDSLPDVTDNETSRAVCIRAGGSCCAFKTSIRSKNCSDFMIYFLIPTPNCARYCYDAPDVDMFIPTHSETGNLRSIPVYSWIIPTILVALIISVSIVWFMSNRCCRQNKIQINEDSHGRSQSMYYRGPQITNVRFNSMNRGE